MVCYTVNFTLQLLLLLLLLFKFDTFAMRGFRHAIFTGWMPTLWKIVHSCFQEQTTDIRRWHKIYNICNIFPIRLA